MQNSYEPVSTSVYLSLCRSLKSEVWEGCLPPPAVKVQGGERREKMIRY